MEQNPKDAAAGKKRKDAATEQTPKGVLYMIPCPITEEGSVWSVLPGANRTVMAGLDYFVVENTRTARRFLSKAALGLEIDRLEFAELNEHTDPHRIGELVAPILQGRSCGMISEAGVPGVADPGALLAAECHRRGIRVVPLVGPSSILLALMASGQNGQSFAFHGYLPVKPAERAQAIRRIEKRAQQEHQSQLFIEAPYRNDKLLEQLLELLQPATRLTVAADITAPGELILTLPVGEWRRRKAPELHKRPALYILGI